MSLAMIDVTRTRGEKASADQQGSLSSRVVPLISISDRQAGSIVLGAASPLTITYSVVGDPKNPGQGFSYNLRVSGREVEQVAYMLHPSYPVPHVRGMSAPYELHKYASGWQPLSVHAFVKVKGADQMIEVSLSLHPGKVPEVVRRPAVSAADRGVF